ncbi:MAG: IclR family transcriptional regulator [Planctomycetota bacterium]|jgi:DNA-binding IclR family transcriptional regulator|nr:IclR family transcriptional regulator [Planctomycetota bacterium]
MAKENRTIKRALDVLRLLKDRQTPLTITQIGAYLKIPRTSAFDIINTLYQEGFIEPGNETEKAYVLGLKSFEIGAAYLQNNDLSPTTRPYLEKLMLLSHATAFLAIESGLQLVYLDKVEFPSAVRTSAQLGSRNDMYCSGLGKALLATYPEEKVRMIFSKTEIKKITENTIVSYAALLDDLQKTRSRGYAVDDREASPEVFCIAAPIYDSTNNSIAAISLSILYSKLTDELIEKYSKNIIDSALQISKKFGYMERKLFLQSVNR